MIMEKKNKKSSKAHRIKNPALRKFLMTLKVSLLIMLSLVLVGGIIFYFAYGKDILAMQATAKREVQASNIDTFRQSETSVIYDSKGKEISELKGEKDVYYLESSEIPDTVKMAFVSVEDKKFYSHAGVDYFAIMRAALQYVKHGQVTQGGSTITQQLVRNVFISKEVTMDRKLREMFYAMQMEEKYSKDQILEFYINNIYFANGYYGIQAASYGYFNKDVNELSLSQIAFLCAIPNGPTRYDPVNNMENTLERRDLILKNMLDDNKILIEEYQSATSEEITLNMQKKKKQDYVETFARYSAIQALMESQGFEFRYDFDSDEDRKQYEENYNELYQQCEQSMYSAGYRIYTSISMSKQKKLQKAVNDELSGFTDKTKDGVYKMQGAAVCINNKNGRVVAIVGGSKQKSEGYTLNRAFQAFRQPGSSIKPLVVYTPAFENGYTPSSIVDDTYFNGGPRNSDGRYSGRIPIRSAVAASKNVVAWKLFDEITPKKGLSYILKMRFSHIVANDYYPSAALGGLTEGVSPLEMASGFATLENEGYYRVPTCIVKITDARDNLIYEDKSKRTQIYSKESSHMMTSCLESVMDSGTGASLKLSNMPCAGKTGTTNDKKDGWFCGFTPYYTTAVWVGYDTPVTVNDLYGSTYPGRIWKNFMSILHANLEYKELADDYYGYKPEYQEDDTSEEVPEDTEEPSASPDVTEEPEEEEPKITKEPEEWNEGTKEEQPQVTEAPVAEPEVPEQPDVQPDEGEEQDPGTEVEVESMPYYWTPGRTKYH